MSLCGVVLLWLALATGLWLGVPTASASPIHAGSRTQGLCGRQLGNMIQLVCMSRGGIYSDMNTNTRNKRGILGAGDPVSLQALHKRDDCADREQGIIQDCCFHRCSIQVMTQYCNTPGTPGVPGITTSPHRRHRRRHIRHRNRRSRLVDQLTELSTSAYVFDNLP